ncbi:MAG: hypothetical protein AUJ92_16740 [Armatimonadetes bacterium CG2_30_59_28]|nr:MAG: hypothetical protein AUJ92_16740 [Armatimonadetes bacterium CG2_30_59_28]PIU64329.1 MAG: hypothetical protein COS85_12855 [Armatimonadetes bacterium CG07_land_8_20_14_0_80_59_28]
MRQLIRKYLVGMFLVFALLGAGHQRGYAVVTVTIDQPVDAATYATCFAQGGTTIQFHMTVAGSTCIGYEWDWGDNTAKGTKQTESHTFTQAGVWTVTATAKLGKDRTATDTMSVRLLTTTLTAPEANDRFIVGVGECDVVVKALVKGYVSTDASRYQVQRKLSILLGHLRYGISVAF